MEKNEKDLDNIELRSEKVRNVIGKVVTNAVMQGKYNYMLYSLM